MVASDISSNGIAIGQVDSSGFWDVWASAVAILISASTATFLALKTINTNKELKRKGETMNFIMQRSRDEMFQKSFSVIREIDKNNHRDIRFFADKQCFDERIEAETKEGEKAKLVKEKKEHDEGIVCLNYLLNQYEYMSVGIKQGIYDEPMLINSSKTSTVKSYNITKTLILALRNQVDGNKSTYEEFQNLAERWEKIK